MPIIETDYQVTVSDFRRASYYGLFLRHRRPLRMLFIVVLGALVYALASALGMGQANPYVFLLAGAYAVWGLFMAAGTEKGIRAYLRSPDKLIGVTFHIVLDERQLHLSIPGRGVSINTAWEKLACAFELQALFLLYSTPQQAWLLPKRALTGEQCAALRGLLRTRLKEHFGTRFEK